MIKRTWFWKVESPPLLKQSRIDKGLITEGTGFISHRSFFVDHTYIKSQIMLEVKLNKSSFYKSGIILTMMSRV